MGARFGRTMAALLLVLPACDVDRPETGSPPTEPSTEPSTIASEAAAPTVSSPDRQPSSAPPASAAPPITGAAIEVVSEGRAEFVPIEGELTFEERRAGGATTPDGINEPWDVWIEIALPSSWSDGQFDICGWTSSRQFSDGCVDGSMVVQPNPWRFGSSSVGDNQFELWLISAATPGRRILIVDPSRLGPGVHIATFDPPDLSIDDVLTQPPGPDGDYMEVG